jgi:hypothetical protein
MKSAPTTGLVEDLRTVANKVTHRQDMEMIEISSEKKFCAGMSVDLLPSGSDPCKALRETGVDYLRKALYGGVTRFRRRQ